MTAELKRDINVYDISKKIDPIKLEKEAKRLKEISNSNKQGLFFTIIDYIMITIAICFNLIIIYGVMFDPRSPFHIHETLDLIMILLFLISPFILLYCYFFIKSLIIRYLLKRDKKFPKNTPKKILKDFKSQKSIEFYKQVLADEFDPNRPQEIDVYDNNIKTIKVIDFDKLEKEAKRLQRILQKYKQNKIINIIDIFSKVISYGILIWGFILFISAFFTKNDSSAGLIAVFGFFLVMIGWGLITFYKPFIILLTYLFTNRAKQLPKNTPQNILIYHGHTPLEFYEKDLYKQFITKIPGDIDFNAYEYEIIQDLHSNAEDMLFINGSKEAENNLLGEAFNLKANVIIRYKVNELKYNEISFASVKRFKSIESKSETHIYALAIKILKEKTNSDINNNAHNNAQSLSSALSELLELKNKGVLSEEEFEDAKKKIIKSY